MSKGTVCGCGRGYVSRWDGQCSNCRSKKDQQALEKRWKQEERMEKLRAEIKAMIEK